MTVYINNLQQKIVVSRKLEELLIEIVGQVLTEEGRSPQVEVGISLVDNEHIRELNRRYRRRDRPTDVLSFFLGEEGEEGEILGDVVISLEQASAQAGLYGHSVEKEVVFLAIHGLLHLLGYDHEDPKDKGKMEERQRELWKKTPWGEKQP